jgi:glycosyl transferase, family 25
MKRIIDYFDRSYIINLKDRVDRRREVVSEFRRSGISIPNDRVRFYTATRPTDSGNFPTIGARGCFTSHLGVLEEAQRDNLRNVLVFEDDVSFRKIGVDFQNRLLDELSRRRWDLLWLGYLKPDNVALPGPLASWTADILGAHCYAVNGPFIGAMAQYMRDCERRPRDHPDGGPMFPDGAYNHVRYVNKDVVLLLAIPQMALQRSSRSDITPTVFDANSWLRTMVPFARRIKHQIRMTIDKQRLRGQLRDRS